jgi:epoxyqueuosine reductase
MPLTFLLAKDMRALNAHLKSRLVEAGASLVGFADISSLPVAVTGEMTSAISIAVALDASIINEISEGPTQRYHHEYTRANECLAHLCASAVNDLEQHGYRASAIDPTIRIEGSAMKTLTTSLPHKTVATRAGLGWIGKSALLITSSHGPAVRLASVLTDAPLDTANPIDDSRCGDCTSCVDRCPTKAILGKNWQKCTERESIYNAHACCAMARRLAGAKDIPVTICGICINACPWTQKYMSREL